jgi:hypothetical protein
MGDINFKNRIKNYFKFLYKNIKFKTNLDECINCTRELNLDIMNQNVLYGGAETTIEDLQNNIEKIIQSNKTSYEDLAFKSDPSIYDIGTNSLKPGITIEQYTSILDPTNNLLIRKKTLEDITEKLTLLSEYLNLSLNYIFTSKSDNGELSSYVKNLNKEDLERLSSELENFIQNISKLADLKIPLQKTPPVVETPPTISPEAGTLLETCALRNINISELNCDENEKNLDLLLEKNNTDCKDVRKIKRKEYVKKCRSKFKEGTKLEDA